MIEREVVTSFLRNAGRILILRRSSEVGTYAGRWAGVSGFLEKDERPIERALKEIWEEVGLNESDVQLVKEGEPLLVADEKKNTLWIVHPFLFDSNTDAVKIDWEHKEYKWIDQSALSSYDTVPMLKETFSRVRTE